MENSDFVRNFYNLEGDSISERKNNFSRLLKTQTVPLSEDDWKGLRPRTYLERLFEIDIFIHFKMYSKLLDVIKEGNEVFISKILKHPLVLKDTIGEVVPERFVNNFLPCTSFTMRMKILKKMSFFLDESQMDEIFYWVHKRYGLFIAKKLLHNCSSKKIHEILPEHEVILKPRQIKFIFNKDPELLPIYLKHYKKSLHQKYSHTNLSRYIATKNPELWLKLQKENLIGSVRLGRRTSKKFICNNNTEFRNNIKYYSEFLKSDAIVRKLQGNFENVYFEHFPRKMESISISNFSHKLLRFYPKSKQWDLFARTFMKVFQSSILDNMLCLDCGFLEFFPNISIKNKWGETRYNEYKYTDDMKYCDPNKVIPLIKEKIVVTSNVYQRTALIGLLLRNCKQNNDMVSLEEVLKYICTTHRNEDILPQILDEISSLFILQKLNENHWDCINEIIKILRLRKQLKFDTINEFVPKYIEHLFLHGKPFKEELLMYIQNVNKNKKWFNIDSRDSVFEKEILTEIITLCPDIIEISEAWKKKFIEEIIAFNRKKSTCIIDLKQFPYLVTYINCIIYKESELEPDEGEFLILIIDYNFEFPEKPLIKIEDAQILKIFQNNVENFYFKDIVRMIITKPNRSKFENDVLNFFWENLLKCYPLRKQVIRWFFAKEPKIIVPYFDRILKTDKKCIKASDIKLMSHLGLDKRAINYCIGKLELIDDLLKVIRGIETVSGADDKEIAKKLKEKIDSNIDSETILILSVLLSTEEFLKKVAEKFLPITGKLNFKNQALSEIYFLQCQVARFLKKLQDPAEVLPILMKFCLGDYLNSALTSLYSFFYRAPEKILYSYIDVLSTRAVSTRKHAVHLSCDFLNYNYAVNKLQEVAYSESVENQKQVFFETLRFFTRNPSEDLLNIVTQQLNTIDKNDVETLKSLTKVNIPQKYKILYIQKCWYFFEDIRKQEVNVEKFLEPFFDWIINSRDIFISLPIGFHKHIITHYFKDKPEKDHRLYSINKFVCMVLQYQKSEEFYNFVFEILSTFRVRKSLKKFFNEFYGLAANDIQTNNKIDLENNYHIELFKLHWIEMFPRIKMFEEGVLLDLLYIKCKFSDGFNKNYAQEVVGYIEALVSEYGPYIYYKFQNLSDRLFTIREKYAFLCNVLEFNNSPLYCILALDLMDSRHSEDTELKEAYDKIIEILKNSTDPAVSVYLGSYLDDTE